MARGILDRALRMGEARQFKEHERRVESINRVEPEMELLDDAELRSEADELRERAANGEPLDDLLPESFALTREAARRTIGQRHFDVQLIGGMVLHDGAIAEMRTGEGKTLTATLPIVLNALAGEAVHLVTVNDYLARRDAEWMAPIYNALGITRRRDPGDRHPRPTARRSTPRTSPTGPTPSSASTTCATTWPARSRTASSAGHAVRDRRRGRQHPHRRGAHPADHLRPPRAGRRHLLHVRAPREADDRRRGQAEAQVAGREQGHVRGRARLRVRREAQDRRADRGAACTAPSSSSASRTSTSPSTGRSSTTSSSRSRRSRSTSATRTTP